MSEISASERTEILADYTRLALHRPPANLGCLGWLLFVIGFCMFVALPDLLFDQEFNHDSNDGTAFTIVLTITLLVVGLWLVFRGNRRGRFRRKHVRSALNELRRFQDLPPAERRAAAVRLLMNAPGMDRPRRLKRWRAEIPDALPYVLAVREVLVAELGGAKHNVPPKTGPVNKV